MVKYLLALILAGLLAGCGSSPRTASPAENAVEPAKGCYQADWQAETVPLVNKRLGPDGLEKYDTPSKSKEPGCP